MQPGSASTGAAFVSCEMLQVQMLLPSEPDLNRAAQGKPLSIVSNQAELDRLKDRSSILDFLRGLC